MGPNYLRLTAFHVINPQKEVNLRNCMIIQGYFR